MKPINDSIKSENLKGEPVFHNFSTIRFFVAALALILAPVLYSQEGRGPEVRVPSGQMVMGSAQGHPFGREGQMTAYVYEDRVAYYDDSLLAEIERVNKLPVVSEDGVLFTDASLVQFKSNNEFYVMQRGWDEAGNCRLLATKLSSEGLVVGVGDTCSGNPCSYCEDFDPTDGCACKPGHGAYCNHSTGGGKGNE